MFSRIWAAFAVSPLRRAYVFGGLTEFWVSLVFGATTLSIIFAMAMLVGVAMWALRTLMERRAKLPG